MVIKYQLRCGIHFFFPFNSCWMLFLCCLIYDDSDESETHLSKIKYNISNCGSRLLYWFIFMGRLLLVILIIPNGIDKMS